MTCLARPFGMLMGGAAVFVAGCNGDRGAPAPKEAGDASLAEATDQLVPDPEAGASTRNVVDASALSAATHSPLAADDASISSVTAVEDSGFARNEPLEPRSVDGGLRIRDGGTLTLDPKARPTAAVDTRAPAALAASGEGQCAARDGLFCEAAIEFYCREGSLLTRQPCSVDCQDGACPAPSSQGTAEGGAQHSTSVDCRMCQDLECHAEFAACGVLDIRTPCKDVAACLSSCSSADCDQECFAASTPQALAEHFALADCTEEHCRSECLDRPSARAEPTESAAKAELPRD